MKRKWQTGLMAIWVLLIPTLAGRSGSIVAR